MQSVQRKSDAHQHCCIMLRGITTSQTGYYAASLYVSSNISYLLCTCRLEGFQHFSRTRKPRYTQMHGAHEHAQMKVRKGTARSSVREERDSPPLHEHRKKAVAMYVCVCFLTTDVSGGPAFLARCSSGSKSLTQSRSATNGPTSDTIIEARMGSFAAVLGNAFNSSSCSSQEKRGKPTRQKQQALLGASNLYVQIDAL